MPLKIIIVGAGLGGLGAAFCLARDGHDVQLYERRGKFEPRGGGIMIRPNATRFLRQWGLQDDFEPISDAAKATEYRDGLTGEMIMKRNTISTVGGHPDWGCNRRDTQTILYKHALEEGAKIKFGVAVEDISENAQATYVRLSSGETVQVDLLLAADGVLSRLRPKIIPNAPSPVPGWSTLYQVSADEKKVLADPDARALAKTPDLQVWMKRGGGAYVVARCNKGLGRMGGVFGIPETDSSNPRLWDEHGDIEYVRKSYDGYNTALTAFLKLVNHCDRWRIAEMPDLPSWISNHGRMILLGDSAHSMFPDAAQGFSQIVEDIAVLSYLINVHSDRGIPALTKIWQDVRIPRVNRIKAWANFNQTLYTKGSDAAPKQPEGGRPELSGISLDDVEPDMNASFRSTEFVKWGFGYDAVADVKAHVKKIDNVARL